jgi:uncharacterized RDD family membrane protein YckC
MNQDVDNKLMVEKTVIYAGFWTRGMANLIDIIAMFVPMALIITIISGTNYFDEHDLNGWDIMANIIFLFATVYMWLKWNGATPGKKLMKIKIVDYKTHTILTPKQAITRYLGYILSTITFCLGFLMIAFHPNKRGLHDILSGTCVIVDNN